MPCDERPLTEVYVSYCARNIPSALGSFPLKFLTSWVYYIAIAILPYGLRREA